MSKNIMLEYLYTNTMCKPSTKTVYAVHVYSKNNKYLAEVEIYSFNNEIRLPCRHIAFNILDKKGYVNCYSSNNGNINQDIAHMNNKYWLNKDDIINSIEELKMFCEK